MTFTGKADEGLITVPDFPSLRGVTTDTDKLSSARSVNFLFILRYVVARRSYSATTYFFDICDRYYTHKINYFKAKKGLFKSLINSPIFPGMCVREHLLVVNW